MSRLKPFVSTPGLFALLIVVACWTDTVLAGQGPAGDSAEEQLKRAELLVQLGKPDVAEPLFLRVATEASVGDLRARALAGQAGILSSESDSGQAAKLYEQAWAQATSAATKSRILVGQAALGFTGTTVSPEARQKLDLAQKFADESADPMAQLALHVVRAVAALAGGNHAEGKRLFGETAMYARRIADSAADPDQKATFRLFESSVLVSQQQWDEALNRTRDALAVPASAELKAQALLLEGAIYQEKGAPALAKARFEDARRATSDLDLQANALAGRGEVDERTGNIGAALPFYDQALELKTGNETRSFLLFKKGTALLKADRLDEALATLEQVPPMTKKESRAARALANMGVALRNQGKVPEARKKLEQALSYKIVRPSIRASIQQVLDSLPR